MNILFHTMIYVDVDGIHLISESITGVYDLQYIWPLQLSLSFFIVELLNGPLPY